jgi:hypothetical protein
VLSNRRQQGGTRTDDAQIRNRGRFSALHEIWSPKIGFQNDSDALLELPLMKSSRKNVTT